MLNRLWGGGTLYWAKSLAPNGNHINDLDPALAKFYNDVKRGDSSNISNCWLPSTKKDFEKAKSKRLSDNTFKDGCSYIRVIKRSYGGRGRIFNMPPCRDSARAKTKDFKDNARMYTVKKDIELYQAKLKKTKVTNKDFCDVMKDHDSIDTFHYLDPPYWETQKRYNLPKVHPNDIVGCSSRMKGNVLITYDNNPEVRKAFRGWRVEKVATKYELQSSNPNARGVKKDVTELLIMNYNPKTGQRIKVPKKAS